MKASKLNNIPEGIDTVEYRDKLYYNKFKYRGSISLCGLRRTYWCENIDQYKERIQEQLNDRTYGNINNSWANEYINRLKQEVKILNYDAIERFLNFKNAMPKDRNIAIVRLESDKASFFSNDLDWLKQLDAVASSDGSVVYSEASAVLQEGIKYFQREPQYKHRVYFRSMKIETKEIEEIASFLKQYNKNKKDKHPPLKPSESFKEFLQNHGKRFYSYQNNWLSGHFYIDYDDEKYMLLVAMKFSKYIYKMFKLEKRPDNI